MSGARVITTRNVYNGARMQLCVQHFASEANGDVQVEHGLHYSTFGCDACKCRHVAVVDGDHYTFTASVNTGGVTDENRAAHGGITYDQTCVDCRRRRRVNQNGSQFEFGAWLDPVP